MKIASRMLTLGIMTLAFSFCIPVQAQLANFDFESAPVDGVHDGTNTALVFTDSGLSITITRTGGTAFDVLNDDASGFPLAFPNPGWGNQALSSFFAPSVNDFFLVNFSQSVDLFGVQMGDFGGDVDNLLLEAYSGLGGSGALIDSTTSSYAGDFNMTGPGDGPANLVVSGAGINSVVFRGGSVGFEHSAFYDNFRVSFVPEPSSLMLFGIAATSLTIRRRRNCRNKN